jgi:hypothetical protein
MVSAILSNVAQTLPAEVAKCAATCISPPL